MEETGIDAIIASDPYIMQLALEKTNLVVHVSTQQSLANSLAVKFFKDKVFNTIIPRLIRLVEAPSHGKPISDYDPTSRATLAYQNLAKEVISRNGE